MIIIPTYNERKNIRPLVDRIRQVLPDILILFVDDNSTDNTGQEIKDLQKNDQNIKLMSRPGKAGFASAYLDAFRFVQKEFDPDFVVTMDADLSHAPENLPKLLGIAKQGFVGIGSRYIKGDGVHNWSWGRRIMSRLGNFYARTLINLPVHDLTAGFMIIPKEFLQRLDLDKIQNRGYAFLMELKLSLSKLGAQLIETPIIFEERREGESKIAGSIVAEGLKYPVKIFLERQISENKGAWLIFFISLSVFVFSLPHTIFFGDSAEFMAAASTLGIPHPPGYPGYVLVAKLFTFLPVGNLEFRLGLFSALSAALSLVVFYFLLLKINYNKFLAFVTSFILAFSPLFWSQAIMAKVYMPLLLIILLILLLIAKFWETKNSKYIAWSLLLFGIGATFHQMILLFLPLLFFALFINKFTACSVIVGIFLFLLGLSVFVYIPIRAKQTGDYYDFSKIFRTKPIDNYSGFKDYILRTEYRDYGEKFVTKNKIDFFTSFLANLWQQFYWLLILAGIGLIVLGLQNRKFFTLTFGLFVLNIFGIILIRSSVWNYENEFLYSFYYLPAFAMVAVWIGIGIAKILENKNLFKAGALMLLLPLFLFSKNYEEQNLSKFNFVDEYTSQVLESLPPDAVLLAHFEGPNTDTVLFGLFYQQIVKDIRPDVTIMTISDIYPEVERQIIAAVYGLSNPKLARYNLVNYTLNRSPHKERPIFTTFIVDDLSDKVTWSSLSNGLVYRFLSDINNDKYDYTTLDFQKDLKILENDMFGKDLLAQYFYTQAAYWVSLKDLHKAQENFIIAINYDHNLMSKNKESFMFYRHRVFGK